MRKINAQKYNKCNLKINNHTLNESKRPWIILLGLVLVSIFLISSCGDLLPNYYSEYDPNLNMIRSYQFGTTDSNGNTWTPDFWAPGYGTPNNEYMTYVGIGDVASGGGQIPAQADDGTTAINGYRLEVMNQIADGDFQAYGISFGTETTAALLGMPGSWGQNPVFNAGDVRIVDGGGFAAETIDNRTLYINSTSNVMFHYIVTNLTTWADAAPAPPAPLSNYVFHFDYISKVPDVYFQVNNDIIYNPLFPGADTRSYKKKLTLTAGNISILKQYPDPFDTNHASNVFAAENPSTHSYFTFGNSGNTGSTNNISIDNLKIVLDTEYFLRIQIPKVPDVPVGSTALALQPGGTYTFSVFVNITPAANITPLQANSFRAQNITLYAKPINGVIGSTYYENIDMNNYNGSAIFNWTEVSVTMNATTEGNLISSNLDSYADSDPIIELGIMASPSILSSISGANPLTSGSVLIALPRLTWQPN
jgi:hypothetical protein